MRMRAMLCKRNTLLALLVVVCTSVDPTLVEQIDERNSSTKHDVLLCRSCGADVADSSYLVEELSPSARRTRRQSSFGHQRLLVQTLVNPFGIQFDIVTVEKARCHNIGSRQSAESWFPGYSWQICTCAQCRRHLGWTFHSDASSGGVNDHLKSFHGLILDNILEENFTDSLLMIPKMYRM